MVMALVTDLGKIRPVCLSRLYLKRALIALESGNTIQAGVLLREACKRYLSALCQYYKCEPDLKCEPYDRRLKLMLSALVAAKRFELCSSIRVSAAIDLGDRLTRCKVVRPSIIECHIDRLHCLLDCSPEILFVTRGDL